MKLLLIEDHKMFAQCLKMDLEANEDIEVDLLKDIGLLEDILGQKNYDLLLVDINLDGLSKSQNGLELSKELIENYGQKVLILTGYKLDFYQEKAKEMGAYGFVSKEESTKDLREKIRGICLEGEKYFSDPGGIEEKLTENELKILRLYASGKSRKEVAQACFMATSSLAVILNRIYSKLEVKNYQEMVKKAREIGYIDPF